MAPSSVLSDELLRHLMAVGQVDILVGVPTLDNAETVVDVVRAVHEGFARHYGRLRTVLINSDGGSTDGTPELVQQASFGDSETLSASHSLRTAHRITAPFHGLPGKVGALRTILAAADLLQAKAVAVFDPEVVSITPDWVARVVGPVIREPIDFVAPVYPRHGLDGPLLTQLVRPLMRAAYGYRLLEPLGVEFGCSGRFATHCLEQGLWEGDLARSGIDLWLRGAAMAGGFRVAQAVLAPHERAALKPRPGLPELLGQVVGSLFACLEMHETFWRGRSGSEPLQIFGDRVAPGGEAPSIDPLPLIESFRSGVRELTPILAPILSPDLFRELDRIAATNAPEFSYPDELWVASTIEFAAEHHRGGSNREHLLQAFVPLYLGRTAAFVLENGASDDTGLEHKAETLSLEFERSKPYLVRRWSSER